jgi:hypothetical protein
MTIHYNTKHKQIDQMNTIAHTLYKFGYQMQDCIRMSKQIQSNLDNYSRMLDMVEARRAVLPMARPKQRGYWENTNA